MAKVVVIDVDLGMNLDQLIAESAQELTKNAKKELDGAISIAQSVKKVKEEKEAQKAEQTSGISIAMEEAYKKLESAGSRGIPVDTIIASVKQYIPNSSAFMLRMKNVLSVKDNPYRLIRAKIDNVPHYLFTAFNKELDKPTEDQ